MPVFRRLLAGEECAVVLRRYREPLLIRGPGFVRTFERWRQVSIVNLSPFVTRAVETDVTTSDGVAMTVRGELHGQVVDPVAAISRVVDYEDATRQILRTAMRALVMQRSSTELDEGRQLDPQVAESVVDAVRGWGIDVLALDFDVARRE